MVAATQPNERVVVLVDTASAVKVAMLQGGLGWSDFLGKKKGSRQFQKFLLKRNFLTWQRASEIFDGYSKIGKRNYFYVFGACPRGGMNSYIFLQFKMKRNLKKLDFLRPIQKPTCPF